jgi:hypothetical protein
MVASVQVEIVRVALSLSDALVDIQIAVLSYIDALIDGLSDSIKHVDSPGIEVLTSPGRPPPKVEGHRPRATTDAEFGEREWSVPDLVLPGEGAGDNGR